MPRYSCQLNENYGGLAGGHVVWKAPREIAVRGQSLKTIALDLVSHIPVWSSDPQHRHHWELVKNAEFRPYPKPTGQDLSLSKSPRDLSAH